MKTAVKSIAAVMAIVIMISVYTPQANALTNAEKEGLYQSAILELETYLENTEEEPATTLEDIAGMFEVLGGYEYSQFFGHYCQVLIYLRDEQFDILLDLSLDILTNSPKFSEYLEKLESPLGTIEELNAYVQGRQQEHDGEKDAAAEYYMQCMGYFDTMDRYAQIMEGQYDTIYENAKNLLSTDLVAAYFEFKKVERYADSKLYISSIIRKLGYEPQSLEDRATPTPSPVPTKNASSYTQPTRSPNTSLTVTATPIPSTAKPVTPTPTAAPVYGNWSGWSNTPVAATSTKQVETKVVPEPVYQTRYTYSRWTYTVVQNYAVFHYGDVYPGYNSEEGEWEYCTTETPLSKTKKVNGHQQYAGEWYNESEITVSTGTQDVVYYRYRDQIN